MCVHCSIRAGRLLFCATELYHSDYIVCYGTFEMAPDSAYQVYIRCTARCIQLAAGRASKQQHWNYTRPSTRNSGTRRSATAWTSAADSSAMYAFPECSFMQSQSHICDGAAIYIFGRN